MELELDVRGARGAGIDEAELRAAVEQALEALGFTGPCTLGVSFVSEQRMRTLNRDHLGHDEVTDVLSFPIDGADPLPDGVARALGDVVVCAAQARRQADEAGVPPAEELRTLLVHGVLHLAGFDHEVDDGDMLARQGELCDALPPIGWAPR